MSKNPLTDQFSEPLNGVTIAVFDIHTGDGNLIIDALPGDQQVLASGRLQYFEKPGPPTHNLVTRDGQASLTLKGANSGRPWFRLPWSACNGATEWRIQLNPGVASDITAYTGGGNLHLDLSGMILTQLSADTGGGNLNLVLPEQAENLSLSVKTGAGNVTVESGSMTGKNTLNASSGAGNVTVSLPAGLAARIHATTGLGKVIVDPNFRQTDKNTYQSADFHSAADQIEITAQSGAGNVSVLTL
jgi:predicted membrane protein